MKRQGRFNLLAVLILISTAVLANLVQVPATYTASAWDENANQVNQVEPAVSGPPWTMADFTDNIRALFVRIASMGTLQWEQVGPGWNKSTPPTTDACEEISAVLGCKPIVVDPVVTAFADCFGSTTGHDVTMNLASNSRDASTYTIERMESDWVHNYTGSENEFFLTVTENQDFRARGNNNYGEGEWVEFSLSDTCVGDPSVQSSFTGFLNCPPGCGYSPYSIDWVGSSNATSYVVQVKSFGSWMSHYSGTNTSTIGTSNGTVGPGYYRLQAVNQQGVSDWVNFTLWIQCSSEQNPW